MTLPHIMDPHDTIQHDDDDMDSRHAWDINDNTMPVVCKIILKLKV